ncbi:MAG TPA: YfiR family protein [Verrucomicrobiae bacterium]|nr:YfiR family protein [Verrucomicrobiae bacterium]
MNDSGSMDGGLRRCRLLHAVVGLSALICFFRPAISAGADEPVLAEYRVKALFLLNFSKYVEWPAGTLADTNAPFVIGIVGQDRFEDHLEEAVKGKAIDGHPFVIAHLADNDDFSRCRILFVSNSEGERTAAVLARAARLPVLTVGEDHTFGSNGGMIDMVIKDRCIRLQINVVAANRCGLKISSKLLAVADTVRLR